MALVNLYALLTYGFIFEISLSCILKLIEEGSVALKYVNTVQGGVHISEEKNTSTVDKQTFDKKWNNWAFFYVPNNCCLCLIQRLYY